MPKSKVDKSRHNNLIKYKQKSKKKMSKAPELKQPFRQVPNWSSQETFEIQGVELEALYNFFNIFAPAFTATQQVFARGIQAGKIKIGYEYEDGSPVSEEEISEYTAKLNEYFKDKVQVEAANSEEKTSQSNTKIVDINGKKASLQD